MNLCIGEPEVRPLLYPKKVEVTCIKIFCCIFSLGAYIADVGSDIYVAVKHYQDGSETYFHLTVLFIVLPAITMSLVTLRGYYQEHYSSLHLRASVAHWTIRMIFLTLLMAPALKSAEALHHAWMSSKSAKACCKKFHGIMMSNNNSEAAVLRLFEAVSECAPQLILQIYIIAQMYCGGSKDISATEIVQLISIVLSLISMTNAIVSYLRDRWDHLYYKKDISCSISIFPLLWRFSELTARVVTLGLFASVLLPYFFLVCGIHLCGMLLFLRFMYREYWSERKIVEFVYHNFVLSFTNVFCFVTPLEDQSLVYNIVYYSFMFVENTVLISLWYHHCSFGYGLPVLCMVFVSFVLAIISMALFYALFHPCRGRLFREPEPEERINKSQSESIADECAFIRELIDKSGRDRGMSEEMQTAEIENWIPRRRKLVQREK